MFKIKRFFYDIWVARRIGYIDFWAQYHRGGVALLSTGQVVLAEQNIRNAFDKTNRRSLRHWLYRRGYNRASAHQSEREWHKDRIRANGRRVAGDSR